MKKNWKLWAILFGGIIIAVAFSALSASKRASAGESRVVTQERIMRYLVGTDEFSDKEKSSADINGDGDINMLDALMIERIEVYGEDYFVDDNETPTDETPVSETIKPEPTASPVEKSTEKPAVIPTADSSGLTPEPVVQPSIKPTQEPTVEPEEVTRKVYLDLGVANWDSAFIYSWEKGETYTQMTPVEGKTGIYVVILPKGVTKFLFINNNSGQWNGGRQSVDLSYTLNEAIFTFDKQYDGKYQGSWSTEPYQR